MKRTIVVIISFLMIGFVACNNSGKNTNQTNLQGKTNSESKENKLTSIEFEENVYDFGELIKGEQITYVFKFKNTGNNDLILSRVRASCGCTVPAYDREPVKPGDTGEIKVKFDSSTKSGHQYRTITVVSNTDPKVHELALVGDVIVKE